MSSDNSLMDCDVLIVGAGPVGTALAVNLAQIHVRTIVIEARAAGERPHAGTNATNARTMEHMRQWGVAPHFRSLNPIDAESGGSTLFVTRGRGHLLTTFERPGTKERLPFSAGSSVMGPQESIERALRARLGELSGVEIRYSSNFEKFEVDGDRVVVSYRDSGGALVQCSCRYLVGADGSRSKVRRQLGIRMEGRARIMRRSIWHIKSQAIRDLLLERHGKAAFTWFVNEDKSGAVIIAQNKEGEFQYSDGPLDDGSDPADWEAAKRRLFRDLGAEVPVEPLFGGEVWLHSLVAPSFGRDRVFLAGESAHLMSTYGGFGMNSGMGDVSNLGWKLAAAVHGWAGRHLLESYSAERVPVIRWIRDLTEDAASHVGPGFTRSGMEAETAEGEEIRKEVGQVIQRTKKPELVSFGAQFGAAYRNSPINVPDGTQPPIASFGVFSSSASPGMRAPHIWLGDDDSLFDKFESHGFTLLRLDASIPTRAMRLAAAVRGVPLRVVSLQHPELREMYGAGLVLIRGDQHVAWRGDRVPEDAGRVIDKVRGQSNPRETRHLQVNGQTWAYQERGSGPLVIFLHGRLSGKRSWNVQIDALCHRYRCVAFDLLGHGESSAPADGWAMNDLVDAVPHLVAALGETTATLVGLSLGAAVSMRVAVTCPSVVRALVTMSAGGDRPSQEAQDRIARFGLTLSDGNEDERSEAVRIHQRSAHAKGWVEAHPVAAMLERQLILSYDRQAMAHVTRLKPDAMPIDMEQRFPDIACPTLVIWGEEDVRADWGPRMKEAIRGSDLFMVPGAGHQVTADGAHAVAARLVEFVDSVHFDSASANERAST